MTRLLARAPRAVLAWLLVSAASAAAHPLDPALLEIRESADAELEVLWRESAPPPGASTLTAVLPDDCQTVSAPLAHHSGTRRTAQFRVRCARGLSGRRLSVSGLRERQTDVLLRLHLADGRSIESVLRPAAPELSIAEPTSRLEVAQAFVRLGVEHIASGFDHLLFVLGLVLLISGRRLVWTITAFTAGHSVTLSLATLGFVHVPPKPIEVWIALSLLMVAYELSKGTPQQQRSAWSIAFAFGLLHGFGFAGALTEVGLPAHAVPLALGAFNIGIEAGQLAFVVALLTVKWTLSRLPVQWPVPLRRAPAYAIGSLSVLWMCERVAAML